MDRQQNKKIIKHLPYVTKSSTEMVKELYKIKIAEGDKIFTMDAKSMYTNIHVDHVLPKNIDFFTNNPLGKEIVQKEGINIATLAFAIETIMKNNIFMFSDTYTGYI